MDPDRGDSTFRATLVCVIASTRFARFWSLLPLLLALSGPLAASDLPFEPDDSGKVSAFLEEGAWIEEGPGIAVRLRLLGEAERLEYLEKTTGYRIDPYGTPPDQDPRYLSFLLEITNTGNGPLMFQSQSAWLRAGTQIQSPLGIDGLSSTYKVVEMKMSPAYERARPAILEGSATIHPDESVKGILVYRMVKERTKKFFIELQLTLPNGDAFRTHSPFRAVKKKKKSKDKKKP
jgi:hypothetical protein